jgi:hypothetical protein
MTEAYRLYQREKEVERRKAIEEHLSKDRDVNGFVKPEETDLTGRG